MKMTSKTPKMSNKHHQAKQEDLEDWQHYPIKLSSKDTKKSNHLKQDQQQEPQDEQEDPPR